MSDISDHYSVFSFIDIKNPAQPIKKYFRDHSEATIQNLIGKISEIMPNIDTNGDVNDVVEIFMNNLIQSYNSCCPIKCKTISHKRYIKPWLTSPIISVIDKKHYFYRKYKRGELQYFLYKEYKLACDKLVSDAKIAYLDRRFRETLGNSADTWKEINSLIKSNDKNNNNIVLEKNNSIYSDGSSISNMFLEHFSNVGKNLDRNIPQGHHDPTYYMGPPSNRSFFAYPSSTHEVEVVVNSFKTKGCNINEIPVYIYKRLSYLISPFISAVFNESLSLGKFPTVLKISRVVPIPKSKKTKDVNEYRPISNLSVMSKIFEKLMCKRLVSYLEVNKVLVPFQFGFRSRSATTDALLQYLDYAYESIDNGQYLLTLFLDFSKAFDTVNHRILLNKLNHVGVRGVSQHWFESYIMNRKQCVYVNGVSSDLSDITMGVPQGSCLGPVLFLLYINDMYKSAPLLKFVHFADDTTAFARDSNLPSLITKFNTQLQFVDNWLCTNRLSLNIGKTNFMIISNKSSADHNEIKIRNETIDRIKCAKFLGVQLDDQLKFDMHVKQVVCKISRVTGIMKKLKQLAPPSILRTVYFSLAYPHLNYALPAWGGCGVTLVNKVQAVQKRVLSVLSFNPSVNIYEQYRLMNFDMLHRYCCSIIFHKISNGTYHDFLTNKLNSIQTHHAYSTRFKADGKLIGPKNRTSKSQQTFISRATKAWNLIPLEIRVLQDSNLFKKRLKMFYLQNMVNN